MIQDFGYHLMPRSNGGRALWLAWAQVVEANNNGGESATPALRVTPFEKSSLAEQKNSENCVLDFLPLVFVWYLPARLLLLGSKNYKVLLQISTNLRSSELRTHFMANS